jgi:hypothetical protein
MATAAMDFTAIDETQADTGQTTEVDTGTPVIGEGEPQQQEQTEKTDGRRGPVDVRAAVKAASEAAPEHAAAIKRLADSHFRAEAYTKAFPTPQDAVAAKTVFDSVGGLDGVAQLQQRGQQFESQEAAFQAGDPAVLDAAFKDFPEGMATLAPHFLDRLAKANPEAFENTIAPHALGLLERSGVMNHIAQMAAETDPVRKAALANQLDQWIKTQSQNVKAIKPQQAQSDNKINEERTQLQKQQEQFFSKQVDVAVNSASAGEMTKVVDQYAKSHKLNDIQKNRFASSLAQRIVNEMLSDETFKKQDAIRKATKDVDRVASFRASEFQRRLPDAAFKEAQELYGATTRPTAPTGEVKPNQPKTAPGGGPLMVSRPMDIVDLDMRKDPDQLLFIQNKGYRKADGMFVQWKG